MVYNKITPKRAKNMVDTKDDVIILDVRTEEEYNQGHIKNALLISNDTIEDDAYDILKNKDINILVYCQSGRRSMEASVKLLEMGYKNVYDLGSIDNWEYDIER